MKTKVHLLSLLGYGFLTSSSIMAKEAQPKPNIIFILSDDHAKSAISAYGGINAKLAPTPNIDKIAEHGTIFNNMLCTNALSGPSRACLVTGKFSTTHGLFQNNGGITFDNTQATVESILKANGYTTSIFGKWHLNCMPTGFDYFKIHDSNGQQGSYWDPVFNVNGVKVTDKGYATNLTAESGLHWLDEIRDKSKPFCMMINFKAPHGPWQPDTKYLHLFDELSFPYPPTFNDEYKGRELTAGESHATIKDLTKGDLKSEIPQGLSADSLKCWKYQQFIKNYLRCVRSVDDNVGNIVDYLKKNGLDKNTIIVYMGDQGFYLGEHGWYDKRWMYEESLQMACIISDPRISKPSPRVNALAMNIDITPTLLDYAGVKIPSHIQGMSLLALLKDEKTAAKTWRKAAYYQYFEYQKGLAHNIQPHYGVRTDRYKLIHFYYDMDVWEFYDLKTDPTELKNQYNNPIYKDKIAQLKLEIKKQQKQYGDDMSLEERRKLTEKYKRKITE